MGFLSTLKNALGFSFTRRHRRGRGRKHRGARKTRKH